MQDNEIAGDDAYKYLEEAPPISILDGTIDSRKNFRMKIDGDPNAVPYDVERTTNLTQNLLPVVLNRPGTDSGLTPLDNPTMPSSVSSQMVQGEEGPLPISRSQRP